MVISEAPIQISSAINKNPEGRGVYKGKIRYSNGGSRTFYGNPDYAYELNAPLIPLPKTCFEMLETVAPGQRDFTTSGSRDEAEVTLNVLGSQLMAMHRDVVGHRYIEVMLYAKGDHPDLGDQTQSPWSGGAETEIFARVAVLPEEGGKVSARLVQNRKEYNELKYRFRRLFPERFRMSVEIARGEKKKENKDKPLVFTESEKFLREQQWITKYQPQRDAIAHFEKNAKQYKQELTGQRQVDNGQLQMIFSSRERVAAAD